MPNIANFRSHLAACVFLLMHLATAQADTLKCGKVSINDGKGSLSVNTFSATRCPKGFELILNVSQFSREVLSAVPPLAGTAAGGALTGTYPNPDIAPAAIGPTQLSTFPRIRVALENTPVQVLGLYGGQPDGFYTSTVPFDTVSYDSTGAQPPNASSIIVPLKGTYFVSGTFTWSGSSAGKRALFIVGGGQLDTHTIADQYGPPAPTGITTQAVNALHRFNQGDTVAIVVGQDSGATLSSANDATLENASLTIQWIGP